MTGGIYRITCLASGRFYIGSTICFEKRWAEHRKGLENGTHHSRHLLRAWKKYGASAFKFEVLVHEQDRTAREALEQRFLDELRPFGKRGFNSAREVGTTRGVKASAATKAKLSARGKGRKHSEESRARMRAARLANNHQVGRPLTEAQKVALFRLNGQPHPFAGRVHSAASRERVSCTKSTPFEQLNIDGSLVRVWPAVSKAAGHLGLRSPDSIWRAAAHGRLAGGFRWRRVTDRAVVT